MVSTVNPARMAAVPPSSDPGSGTPAPPAPRMGRLRPGFRTAAHWARRPALAVGLLGVAVAVSVVEGQPPPAARDSGVSVPAAQPYTDAVGTLLVVDDGALVRFDTRSRLARPVPLPTGLVALRAWAQAGRDVVLGRLPSGRTAAYALAEDGAATSLGPAEVIVPSTDRTAVWLVSRRVATRVPLGAGARRSVPLPRASRLVGDTPAGLIVSTGTVPDARRPGRRPAQTPTPATPGLPAPTPPAATLPPRPEPTTLSASPSTIPPALVPTTPPYTTASPVPSTGPSGVPLTTLVVSNRGAVRYVARAEALATAGDVVLLRDGERRLGVLSARIGPRSLRWLPKLNAVEVTGPGSLDATGRTFAVLARVNDYARLMVGPTAARTEAAINVVPLDGGPPRPGAAPPTFTVAGRVLAARPDGRVLYYTPGGRAAFYLGDDLPSASAVSQV